MVYYKIILFSFFRNYRIHFIFSNSTILVFSPVLCSQLFKFVPIHLSPLLLVRGKKKKKISFLAYLIYVKELCLASVLQPKLNVWISELFSCGFSELFGEDNRSGFPWIIVRTKSWDNEQGVISMMLLISCGNGLDHTSGMQIPELILLRKEGMAKLVGPQK